MSVGQERIYARRRRTLALCCFAALLGLIVLSARPGPARAEGGGALVAEPISGAVSAGVHILYGASPAQSPSEVWGVGSTIGEHQALVRYTEEGGWETQPAPINSAGQTVSLTERSIPQNPSAGRTTPAGGVVLVASLGPANSEEPQALLVRDPDGLFRSVEPPEGVLQAGEKLFSLPGTPTIRATAVEEPDGDTGAFVVPVVPSGQATNRVLHYNGSEWASERICISKVGEQCIEADTRLTVLAIEGSSPENVWMLARRTRTVGTKVEGQGIILLKRAAGGEWFEHSLGGAVGKLFESAEPAAIEETKFFPAIREKGQPLTVSPAGVWVDATVKIGSRTAEPLDATFYYDATSGEVTGSWCDIAEANPAIGAALCTRPLGFELPAREGRSFAWPGNGGEGEEFGTRTITGIGQGAIAVFEHGAFVKIPLDGNGGSGGGAALSAPEEGWLGPPVQTLGSSGPYRLTRSPILSGLQAWPVPFRRPLNAIVAKPGTEPGALGSEAIAVGAEGQAARYLPGVGWQPEALLTGSGTRATPDLRGVAWPEPGVAYAVGSEGAMWLWRASTGLWEPDPGAPPNLIRNNFTAIAFQPGEPVRGYAVGQQGLLLAYGKRWTQEPLPAGVNPEANITSIAFAGSEAIATYSFAVLKEAHAVETITEGGVMVNDGSGWTVDEEAGKVLAGAEEGEKAVPWQVAGLPDGGAVVVGGSGGVIEREAAGAPWHAAPGAPVTGPAAVAAIREGGQVRAIVAVSGSESFSGNSAQAIDQPEPGEPPLLLEPTAASGGLLVRQTATGWRDEQRQNFPPPEAIEGQTKYDMPREPDGIRALLISPEGKGGWLVGGNGGAGASEREQKATQTAAVTRYGENAALPENSRVAPIQAPAGAATFAIGGGASCVGPCSEFAGTGIGPEAWLRSAVEKAGGISGLRAFLYTGGGVAEGAASTLSRRRFGEEEAAYARRLGSAAGSLPVYPTPSGTDLYQGSLSIFASAFAGFPQPLGQAALPTERGVVEGEGAPNPAENDSYSFVSAGPAGENPVRVIMLDNSVAPLSSEKKCWLAAQLAAARAVMVPAIVVGNLEVGTELELEQILVTGQSALCPQPAPGAASAYFYQGNSNRQGQLAWGGSSIPAFGTGTLGYVRIVEAATNEHSPASGYLLAAVGTPNANDVAPVSVSLEPNIESLSINADDGTLLRRSQVALFEGLARRPLGGRSCAGNKAPESCEGTSPDPYVQIPDRCIRGFEGASCATELLAEYRFTSSRPDIANFVEVDPASTNPRAAYLQNGKPVPDPKSGLLCAFNAGTTTVTLETGGLSYSVPVTVQAGSVAQPCGTVPLSEQPVPPAKPTVPPPPPPPSETPPLTHPSGSIPPPQHPLAPHPITHPIPVVSPSAPPVHHPIKPPVPAQLPFFQSPTPQIAPIPVIVPPPPAPVVEPTPPSGTSPVTQPAVSPQPEEEEEAAFDLVHHMSAYRLERARNAAAIVPSGSGGAPISRYFVPAMVLLLAMAGAGIATPRRRTSSLAYANRATPRRPPR